MTDIVERLRDYADRSATPPTPSTVREAADEIERLNAELDNHALLVEKLERQDAELERLRAEASKWQALSEANAQVAEACQHRCERLCADSERLVWLIESIRGADLYRICYPYLHNPETVGNVIAAIDAARGKRKP